MMKNWTHRIKIIVGCTLLLLAVGMSFPVTARAAQDFIVGFDAEFPPYGYMDNGEYVGFDLDLAQGVCQRRGWNLIKRPINWDAKDAELSSGTISCIWNGFTMNGRENDYTWSEAYVDNSQVVLVKKGSSIHSLSDLAGKILVVQTDSSALAALTGEDATEENKKLRASLGELQQVKDYNTAIMNLESGMVDAIALDIGVANYQLEGKEDKLEMLSERLSSENYGIGFKKGNTKLRDEVQTTLNEMVEDGTFAQIAAKWKLTDSVCLKPSGAESASAAAVTATGSGVSETTGGSGSSSSIWKTIGQLGEGMGASLAIFMLTLLFSLPLGLLLCVLRMSRFRILQWIARIYISIMRGTPLMLQLLVVLFAPYYVFGIPLSFSYRFYAVIIGFSLNYAAYFAEIYRSGFQGIPVGQREAATLLGYGRRHTYFRILFPQMVKRVLPPVTNEVITLVKDTSLAYVVSFTEMFYIGQQLSAAQKSLLPLFVAGAFYYVFNFVIAFIMEKVEKKFNYYQ